MQQLVCPSCSAVNNPGDTICRECNFTLVPATLGAPAVPIAPVVQAAPYVERTPAAPVMVVDGGMTDQAKILTALFAIVGLVLVGVAFYAWSESNRSQDDLERARLERTSRPVGGSPAPASPTTPAPVVITAPAPTVVTSPTSDDAPNSREIAAYVSGMEPILKSWRDEVVRAESSDPMQITTALTALRNLETRAASLNPPTVAAGVHGRLLSSMRNMLVEITAAADAQTAVANSRGYAEARKVFEAAASECIALQSALS